MHVSREEFRQIVERIWEAVLEMEVQACDSIAPPVETASSWTGRVQITGGWEGSVCMVCPDELARLAAALIFGTSSQSVTAEQVSDAIGELTNITGGNVKALLPEPCCLSLPAVVSGTGPGWPVGDRSVLVQAGFQCRSLPFQIVLSSSRQGVVTG